MTRQSVGAVEFRDLGFNTRARIVITRIPENNMTNIFLNLDVDGIGVIGAGDCEIGLDSKNTRRVLTLVHQAMSTLSKENHSWQRVGEAEFSWSDQSESKSGEDSGVDLIESNGVALRMVIRTRSGAWAPYVATFNFALVDDLSTLLSRATLSPSR